MSKANNNLPIPYRSFFRPAINAMSGYTPGEQPKIHNLIKLNTNENPYPPAPAVQELLRTLDYTTLRLYPDPTADGLRSTIAGLLNVEMNNIMVGNGSDDILTIVVRCFCDSERPLACPMPTYSLYPVLAELQGSPCLTVPLDDNFGLPDDFASRVRSANLLVLARPNAPTGNSFPKAKIAAICEDFQGAVLIDEAYADFADDNCLDLAMKYPNVIISRTMSKSYSLAGARLGYVVAHPEMIAGLMKMKDSYNVNMLTQKVATAAFRDQIYLRQNVNAIIATRDRLTSALRQMNFRVLPSETNFLFVEPPDRNGRKYFEALRQKNIIVRYFNAPRTASFVRISIGTDAEIDRLLEVTRALFV